MNEDALLGKVDDSRRKFLKKLALGSAYAVPAMATLSLDSVRSKAFAQGVYVAPGVLGFGFVPGGGLFAGQSQGNDVVPVRVAGWYELTFNKPMNQSKGSIACTPDVEVCRADTRAFPPESNPVDLSCNDGWFWHSETKQRLEVTCGDFNKAAGAYALLLYAITVTLSGYEDTEGNPLEGQTTWSAKNCDLLDQCFGPV